MVGFYGKIMLLIQAILIVSSADESNVAGVAGIPLPVSVGNQCAAGIRGLRKSTVASEAFDGGV